MAIQPVLSAPNRELQVHMLRTMVAIRAFEYKAKELFKANLVRGSIHFCIGQEAVCAGGCAALNPDDVITSTHRGHGHCLAKGGAMAGMFAEVLGREGGLCRGRGGSMHIADLDVGILGANGIVGGGIPMAVGAALGFQMMGQPRVAVAFFGDGALNQGSFHEAANLAAVWRLPVVFVVENNQYGMTTPCKDAFAITDLSLRAVAYGFPGQRIDGNDVLAVYGAVRAAAERARAGEGPTLIVAETYRWEGHFTGDPDRVRPREEIEAWKARDPIQRFVDHLMGAGYLAPGGLEQIQAAVQAEIEAAVQWALASPEPDPAGLYDGVYTE